MAAYMNMIIGLLVVFTFVFILAGIPIYVSLLMTGVLSLLVLSLSTGTPMATIAVSQAIFNGIGSLPLLAIPFFMLAGEIMNRGKITDKLIRFAMLLIGRLPGGLAHTGIVWSMFFGGITGSAQACASCMGGILIPTMVKEGYQVTEAVGASVGAMFMGGIIPGILCGVVLMGVVLLRDRTQHFPRQTEKLDKTEKRQIIIDGIIPLGMPIVVVGGIMCGIMTPTEAGAISVVYSLFVRLFVIKTLKIREIGPILLQAVNSTGPLLLIIACAGVFSYGLTALKMPLLVNNLILSLTSSKYAFLLLLTYSP